MLLQRWSDVDKFCAGPFYYNCHIFSRKMGALQTRQQDSGLFSASYAFSLLIGLIPVLSFMVWMCRTHLQTTTLIPIIRGNLLPCGFPHVLAVVDISQLYLRLYTLLRTLNFFTEIAVLTHKFLSVTLYRNKTVRYAARMHAILACQMEFQLYPMDIQICPMFIESCELSRQLPY